MGKATRWLRALLGMKKDKENMGNSNYGAGREKKKWSFGKPDNNSGQFPANDAARLRPYISDTEKEQNKHAIAVAAATAAAADAAVAAAQAAVAVLRLTSQGRGNLFRSGRESWAALKIQTAFRGYLSRKALRALKGLVKLQALVRGYLVRKQATATLHSMEALIRAQTAVRSRRAFRSFNKDRQFQHKNSMGRFDETKSAFHSKRISSSCNSTINGSDDSSKIVEIDTYKPTTINHSLSIPNCRHPRDSEWCLVGDEYNFFTAQRTPRFTNSGRFKAPVSPAKSVSGDSFFRPYSNFPSYMADTQSFRAKLRSHSAPKQRPEAAPKRRVLLNEIMASRSSLSGVRMQRSCSQGFDL